MRKDLFLKGLKDYRRHLLLELAKTEEQITYIQPSRDPLIDFMKLKGIKKNDVIRKLNIPYNTMTGEKVTVKHRLSIEKYLIENYGYQPSNTTQQ